MPVVHRMFLRSLTCNISTAVVPCANTYEHCCKALQVVELHFAAGASAAILPGFVAHGGVSSSTSRS